MEGVEGRTDRRKGGIEGWRDRRKGGMEGRRDRGGKEEGRDGGEEG